MLLLKEFQVQVFIFFNGLSSWDFASTKYFRRFPQNYSNQIDRNQFDLHGPLILVGAATAPPLRISIRSGFFIFHFFDLKFFLGILQDNKIFFGDWTFFKGSLDRVMASQRPRLVLTLNDRKKYLKIRKVAQNFSFF